MDPPTPPLSGTWIPSVGRVVSMPREFVHTSMSWPPFSYFTGSDKSIQTEETSSDPELKLTHTSEDESEPEVIVLEEEDQEYIENMQSQIEYLNKLEKTVDILYDPTMFNFRVPTREKKKWRWKRKCCIILPVMCVMLLMAATIIVLIFLKKIEKLIN